MSRFLNDVSEYKSENPADIAFDDATKLSAGGSTCDIFRTRWQRREVFVKRLKEEFRSKPLYLDALEKDFDIGVSLKHPSLPVYHAFHTDYIIMDYIDGTTLAEMITGKDRWLTNEKNIVKLLKELIEVVGYLHRHNVVHCDIKADNIMITANNSNLVLIDFDKSYTDALNDTSGHPSIYGLTIDDVGKKSIDFNAIGMLVEKLKREVPGFKFDKYKQFVKACRRPDANCEDLKDILARAESSSSKIGVIAGAGIIIGGVLLGLLSYLFKGNDKPGSEADKKDSMVEHVSLSSNSDKAVSEAPSQEEIHADAREKAALLDQRIQPSFNKLLDGLDQLIILKNDSTLTGQQLLDSIRHHSNLADEYIAEAFEILNDMYPGLTDREAWRIMAYSKAYTEYTRRASPELKEYGHEIERRFKAEVNEITK